MNPEEAKKRNILAGALEVAAMVAETMKGGEVQYPPLLIAHQCRNWAAWYKTNTDKEGGQP